MHGDHHHDTLLTVHNLSVELGGREVLSNISFGIQSGEFLAILGPNGSGKSTLLKALLGILPSSGTVTWSERPLNISFLPEGLSPEKFRESPLTLKEFFREKTDSHEKILEAFSLVGLKEQDILDRNPGELSAGQFQRMLIAWSIIDKPDVLLFDEPTLGIDIGGEETIYTLLHKLWKGTGLTIILVTHEINVVFAYATHVLCIRREKLFSGEPKEILTPENLQELYGSAIRFHTPHA
ncbi:MAG TPA: metal ABC transporter ATP-binding protein [Candidatus Paceibacterota bacterium]|nr:metal ABC transporter ATP-binding protein [Candidatus Paceibacterota bacterium]